MNNTNRFNWALHKWSIPLAFISLALGFLLSTQFKSQAEQRAIMPTRRLEELANLLKESEQKRLRLEQEIVAIRAKLNNQNQQPVKPINNSNTDTITSQIVAGVIPVQGQGITVTIEDSKMPLNKGENPLNSLIHSEDLLKIINELKAAGAEAISINEQRLITNSEISCAGPVIIVNQTRIVPPFEIKAIGDTDTMVSALKMRGGILEYLQFFGISINILSKSKIVVPAYNGSLKFKYLEKVGVLNGT